MRSEKEAIFIKTILYADVLASSLQNVDDLPPSVSGPLKAYLSCREANGHARHSNSGIDGLEYKNGVN
jgi:hypothetical protein